MASNIYRHTFSAVCPGGGGMIIYRLTLETDHMVPVDDIWKATNQIHEGFHEDIADTLSAALGGSQSIVATHRCIEIETYRPPALTKPEGAE